MGIKEKLPQAAFLFMVRPAGAVAFPKKLS